MNKARQIVDKFGGQSALARILGHRNPSTVQGWMSRGVIPVRQLPAVIRAARDLGINVTPEDFLPDE